VKTFNIFILFALLSGIVYARPIPISKILLQSGGGPASAPTLQECMQNGIVSTLAPWYCSQINEAAAEIWYEWEPIAAVTALAALILAIIIFVIGAAIKNEKIRNFGLGEIYEAIATIIIVVLFLYLSATMFGILPSITTGNIDPYSTALTYISHEIGQTMYLERVMFSSYLVDSYYASIKLKVNIGDLSLPPVTEVLSRAINLLFLLPINAISSMILDGLFLLYMEFYAILFFMYASIPVFLIPGIILRALFPTRSAGGMMIAIAIGFYFIMPTLFAVAFYFTSTSAMSTLYTEAETIAQYSQGTGVETNAASPTSPLVLAIKGIQQGMGPFWLSLLFYPALIIAITYQSINIIAEFIGGFAKTTGRLRAV